MSLAYASNPKPYGVSIDTYLGKGKDFSILNSNPQFSHQESEDQFYLGSFWKKYRWKTIKAEMVNNFKALLVQQVDLNYWNAISALWSHWNSEKTRYCLVSCN